jgi:hypothetical protein
MRQSGYVKFASKCLNKCNYSNNIRFDEMETAKLSQAKLECLKKIHYLLKNIEGQDDFGLPKELDTDSRNSGRRSSIAVNNLIQSNGLGKLKVESSALNNSFK